MVWLILYILTGILILALDTKYVCKTNLYVKDLPWFFIGVLIWPCFLLDLIVAPIGKLYGNKILIKGKRDE